MHNRISQEFNLFDFYVYLYLREDGTPYYAGKGCGNRAFIEHRINGKGVHTPKDKSRIVFPETNLTEVGAFALERRMIRWYGRKDLGTGILHNRTDGGEGSSGLVLLDSTKQKIREANLGKKHSNKTKQKMADARSGKPIGPLTIDHRQKISNKLRGRVQTEEEKQARRLANLGKVQEKITCPHCGKEGGTGNMKRYHFDKCKEKK